MVLTLTGEVLSISFITSTKCSKFSISLPLIAAIFLPEYSPNLLAGEPKLIEEKHVENNSVMGD